MNRIQFFVLTGLASVIFLLIGCHIGLVMAVNHGQMNWAAAQQVVNQGNIFQGDLKQLAVRIYTDSQRTGDPKLKDLLARQQITYTPTAATNSSETPATPSTH